MSRRAHAWLFGLLTLAVLVFIFSNSLQNAEESSADSGKIAAFFLQILRLFCNPDAEKFHNFIRKTAHFTEFAALGAVSCLWLRNLLKNRRLHFPLPTALSAAAAFTDEMLQRRSEGRACSVWDMLLDTCGAVCAVTVLTLLHRRKTKKAVSSRRTARTAE